MINNAGNLRGKDGGFRSFATPEEGYNALVGDITAKVTGNSPAMRSKLGDNYQPTISNLISVYAPPTENDTQNYINFVAKDSGIDPNTPLTKDDINRIIPSMIKMEKGAKGAEVFKQYASNGQQMNDATDYSKLSDEELLKLIPQQTEDYTKLSDEELLKLIGQQPKQQEAQEPNYFERVSADIQQAGQKAGELLNNNQNMNPVASGIQLLGQGANIAVAPVAQAVRSGISALPDAVTQPIGRAAGAVSDTVKGAYQSGISSLAETGAGKAVGDYLMESPRVQAGLNELSDTAKAAGTIATTLPVGKAITSVTAPIAKKAGEKVAPLISDITSGGKSAIVNAEIPISADDIKIAATNAYKTAETQGGVFNKQFSKKLVGVFDDSKPKPIAGEVLTSQDKILFNTLDEYTPLKGKSLTLEDIQRIDETLGDKIDSLLDNGRVTKPAKKIMDAQQKLRDLVDSVQAKDLVGGKAGVDALKDARPLWSAQAKMRDLEKIVTRAELMDNPATGIKTGFRNLYLNDKKMRGYPDEIKTLIKKAAETGVVGDLLGIAGSRLNPIIGGAVGGVKGSIVANATSMAARGAKSKLQIDKAQKVSDAVANQVRPLVDKYKSPLTSLPTKPANPKYTNKYPKNKKP